MNLVICIFDSSLFAKISNHNLLPNKDNKIDTSRQQEIPVDEPRF